MRHRVLDILLKTGFFTATLSLLFVAGTGTSETFAADKSLTGSAATTSPVSENKSGDVDQATRASVEDSYGKLLLSFEANKGQADRSVKYISRGNGYTLFLTSTEAVLKLRRGVSKAKEHRGIRNREAFESERLADEVIRLKPVGANPNPKITGLDGLPGRSNYFMGKDPAKWHTDVSNYAKVSIKDVYPGIDLIYYGNQRQLEYDWIVNPGAHPDAIRFAVDGKSDLKVDARGDLLLDETGGIRLNKPFIYQQHANSRTEIAGKYVLLGKREVGFQLEKHDPSLPLVIDPVLGYSTYLGGSDENYGIGISVDSSGNAYVTGYTYSTDFPTENPIQDGNYGSKDVFVTKLNASGKDLLYSTYIGGTGDDEGWDIAVDASGSAYVAGYTYSGDFPMQNPLQGSNLGSIDAFVLKLNDSGNALSYATYLGGGLDDHAYSIALDSAGNAYVTGTTYSVDFPTQSALQGDNNGGWDVFVTKLNVAGDTLVYSTYLGGISDEDGNAIAVDSSGNAYVTGNTLSTDFPTQSALQVNNNGDWEVFVAKLNAAGDDLAYSTYLGGGDGEFAYGIAVDSTGSAYVTGYTYSTDFPMKNALQSSYGGNADVFITKLNAAGNALVYSTYLGGSEIEEGAGIAVDSSGNAYVGGDTYSTDFPIANSLQESNNGDYDAFVAKLNAAGSALVYSTYLGGSYAEYGYGIAVDASGNAYITGYTESEDFPTANAFQGNIAGYADAFITRIGLPVYSGITLGDIDGDGKADFSIWRPNNGSWYILNSGSPGTYKSTQWGVANDVPVAGDYDGDGKMDIAVWRPSTGVWYILSSNAPGTYTRIDWGQQNDIPVPLDYDGDGKMNVAVWRPGNGTFYVLSGKSPGTYTATKWGMTGDVPVFDRIQK